MKRVKRETMKCKMFLVKRQKGITENDKEKEYMRDLQGSRESRENLMESEFGKIGDKQNCETEIQQKAEESDK
jgi:hypothetical protein